MMKILHSVVATLTVFVFSPGAGIAQTSFPATHFAATHNSYSGNISGQRGSIEQQLASGARFIEYDINLGNYAATSDYQIGHGSPGRQVDHSAPNPASNLLADWLRMLAKWSDTNPGHAPITLGLDSKNNLSDLASPSDGNLSALNAELQEYLGARLFTAAELGGAAWPSAGALKNRILVVLSGDRKNRELYRSDQAKTPAVAINEAGQAIVVYQSTSSSNLWYWYGNAAGGAISWPVHGKYDSGTTPAVAIDSSGLIVEVHKSQTTSELWSHVGRFRNGQVEWGKSQKLGATGSLPSVAFTSDATVSEIHLGGNDKNQQVLGTVDAAALTIQWSSAGATSAARYPTASSVAGVNSVSVSTGKGPAGTPDTLFYSTPQVSKTRLVYPQLMFTEVQKGDPARLNDDGLSFYACSSKSGNWSWATQQRQAGKVVRMWAFGKGDVGVALPPNFPATDTPYESWYLNYCRQIDCQQ